MLLRYKLNKYFWYLAELNIISISVFYVCSRRKPDYLGIRVGSSITNKGGKIHTVERVVVHERFNKDVKLDNDIALMKARFLICF